MKSKTLWTIALAWSLLLWACWDNNKKSEKDVEEVPSELLENLNYWKSSGKSETKVIYPAKYDSRDKFDENWNLIEEWEEEQEDLNQNFLEEENIDTLTVDSLQTDSIKADSLWVDTLNEENIITQDIKQQVSELTNNVRWKVFITIDDWPWQYTAEIAEELHKRWHHATFFMLGSNMNEGCYEAMRHAVNLWHEIWNHSYSHPNFRKISFDKARWELERTKSVIEDAWIKPAPYFRFPYWNSFSNEKIFDKYLKGIWYEEVFWNIDTRDWSKSTTKKDLIRCLEKTKPGDIILIHERSYTKDRTIPTMDSVLKSKWLISVPYRKK